MKTFTIIVLLFTALIAIAGVFRMDQKKFVYDKEKEEELLWEALHQFEGAIARYGRTTNGFGRTNIACYAEALLAKYSETIQDPVILAKLKTRLEERVMAMTNIRVIKETS